MKFDWYRHMGRRVLPALAVLGLSSAFVFQGKLAAETWLEFASIIIGTLVVGVTTEKSVKAWRNGASKPEPEKPKPLGGRP